MKFFKLILFFCTLLCLVFFKIYISAEQSPIGGEELTAEFSEDLYDSVPEENEGVMVLDLETALDWALNHNLQLQNTAEGTTRAFYLVKVAYSEFDIQIIPSGDLGYAGGAKGGAGLAIGTELQLAKKLAYGTTIAVRPSIHKVNRAYDSNVRTLISQPLLRGFGQEYTLSNVRAAEFELRSASRMLYIAQSHLISRTITTLYDLLKAQKAVSLAQESYNRVRKFHQAAQIKGKIGISDPLDIYRAEIELQHTEDALTSALDRMQDTEDALRDILALPPDVKLMINIPIKFNPLEVDLSDVYNIAFDNRIEVQQSVDQLCERERLSRVAKDRLLPEVNLVFNYSNCGEDQLFSDACFGRRENRFGVGLLTSTDFNPTAERVAYEQSILAIEVANRNIDLTKNNITFEVKKALRHLERAKLRIELEKKQIQTSESELRLAQLKFDRGIANNFDLIQAEKSFRNSQLNYWGSIIDHIIGEYKLRDALGLLMERPEVCSLW